MEEWVALIVALGVAVPAILTSAMTLLNFRESRRNGRQLDATKEQLDRTSIGVEKTHTIVNSQRTAMETEIVWLKERINEMHGLIREAGRRRDEEDDA